jgi:hypothetical protein
LIGFGKRASIVGTLAGTTRATGLGGVGRATARTVAAKKEERRNVEVFILGKLEVERGRVG